MEEISKAIYQVFPFTKITYQADDIARSVIITTRWCMRGKSMAYDFRVFNDDLNINPPNSFIIKTICEHILSSMYEV